MKLSTDGKILLQVDNQDIDSDGNFKFPNDITTIGESAFEECTNLKKLVIPSHITDIKKFAFWNCTQLKNVVLPKNLTKIAKCTFNGCTSLETVRIPPNVTVIGKGAFYNCRSLKNIILPEKVTKIGRGAIHTCPNLEAVFISKNIVSIGHEVFDDCENLKSIFTDGNDTEIEKLKSLFVLYKFAIKVASINRADKEFLALYDIHTNKTSQANSPVLFFKENKNLAEGNNKSDKNPENLFDELPNCSTFP
ncbi:Uncharacterised protein [Legionella busanensis]|uniref:Uncharacterized protein n=1 Tax=Legionella busanensis TaxID=190655 RepID=A0A378JNA5_9GAMM|nr:leucine-rich repeat domain-containing protein [Legionella busanensis]STX51490.1 Uncharacterised protein [Legionella busanensis]